MELVNRGQAITRFSPFKNRMGTLDLIFEFEYGFATMVPQLQSVKTYSVGFVLMKLTRKLRNRCLNDLGMELRQSVPKSHQGGFPRWGFFAHAFVDIASDRWYNPTR
jgi:hypothetical protein